MEGVGVEVAGALSRDTCTYKKLLPPPSDQVRAAAVRAL